MYIKFQRICKKMHARGRFLFSSYIGNMLIVSIVIMKEMHIVYTDYTDYQSESKAAVSRSMPLYHS